MSLYGMLFGESQNSDGLWDVLKLDDYEVGRYRDIYIREYTSDSSECKYGGMSPGKYIVLLTRNGGGNREYYEGSFESLRDHPNYLDDWDCDWDCTYAEIAFSIPEKVKEEVEKQEPVKDRGEAFDDLLNALRNKKL